MKSPFKFLDSYTKDDREIFFGREREIEELYHRVFESKIMLVYGVSGTGKSSLIHCGLANKFQDTDWLPLVIRRGGNMPDSLADAIRSASVTPQTGEITTPSQFRKAVRSIYLDHYKPIFFVFDQFEELFILGNREEKHNFIRIIKTLHESDIQCRFIFILREEYMASITEFERSIPTIFQNRVRVEKMSHLNATEAIKGPCKVAGIELEEGFAGSLLEKLSPEGSDVELTYLQVYLDKIFKISQTDKTDPAANTAFTISTLQKTGDVTDILGSFLDDQISLLSDPEKGLTVLKSFVTVKGTKQPMKEEEVIEYVMTLGMKPDKKLVSELIRVFISLRILCEKDQNDRYELRHDALAAKIYEKFTISEKELLEVRKFVENAFFTFESRGILLNKDDLDYLKGYDNKLILPSQLNEFVEKSKQKLLSQKKSLVLITRISAIVFLLLIASVARIYINKQASSEETNQIAGILLQSKTDPVYAIFQTLKLWKKYTNSSVILQHIVLQNFQNLITQENDTSGSISELRKELTPSVLKLEIIKSWISREGNYIFGWLSDNKVFLFNLGLKNVRYFDQEGEPVQIEISEADSLMSIVYKNNKGIVCDFNGVRKYEFKTLLNDVMNERLVCFFTRGENQLAVARDSCVEIFNSDGEIRYTLSGHKGRINAINLSPDGRFIATASSDKKVYIWNYDESINNFSIYDSLIGHNGEVWSCEFNRKSNYILTASADSSIRIWNLNGKEAESIFLFGLKYKDEFREKSPYGQTDPDASDKNLSVYYRKCCNARFSPDELTIVATNYSTSNDSSGKEFFSYNQVLFYDVTSTLYLLRYNMFYFLYESEEDVVIPEVINHLEVSSNSMNVAAVVKNNSEIDLLGPDGLTLVRFKGNNAFFTKDGKYLIIINGTEITRFPVEIDEIQKLMTAYKILPPKTQVKGLIKTI